MDKSSGRQLANSPTRQLAWEGSRLFATQKQISLNQASFLKPQGSEFSLDFRNFAQNRES
jgi:hypothetical protein